jgi:hypothetical protein
MCTYTVAQSGWTNVNLDLWTTLIFLTNRISIVLPSELRLLERETDHSFLHSALILNI